MKQQPGTPTRTVIVNGVERTPEAMLPPSDIYQGLLNQRQVLRDQLDALENQRRELNSEVQQGRVQGASKVGVENRIMSIDKRIGDMEKQIAGVEGQLATTAAIPGAVDMRHENMPDPGPPEEAFVLGALFMVIVLLPLSIAMARRIWKRSSSAVAAIPADLMARLARIEQAVDTSAVEIERIGEGQRFVTKILSEAKVPVLPSNSDRSS